MAVVTPEPSFTQSHSLSRLIDTGRVCGIMANRGEVAPNAPQPLPMAQVIEDQIYVAVGKEVKDGRMTLIWAIQNSGGKKICIIYVLVPAQKIPVLGSKLPVRLLEETKVREFREIERHDMHKILDEYLNICSQMGVRAEKLFLEKDSIEKGILELIDMHGIRKLVMGAASNRRYSRRMAELKSKKAVYIRDEAPVSCHVWFICNGRLIYTRKGNADRGADTKASLSCTSSNVGNSNLSRSSSGASRKSEPEKLTNPQDMLIRVLSSGSGTNTGRLLASHLQCDPGVSEDTRDMLNKKDSFHEWDRVSRRNSSLGSAMPCSSRSSQSLDGVPLPLSTSMTNDDRIIDSGISKYIPPIDLLGNDIDKIVYDKLEQALSESDNAKREAIQETIRRGQAEKAFLEAARKVWNLEIWLSEEKKQREDMEKALAIEEEEVQKMKNQLDEVSDELHHALDQNSQLESQISHSDNILREYEQKIISAVGLLQSFREERENLQIERDSALREVEELRRHGETSSSFALHYLSEIPFSEIEEATQNFDPSMKIGEGGYGSMYKGCLRHTQVVIKMFHSMQGPSEFQQEADILSKVRHPNIITLIGACPDALSLVYEYLPNGSLEDRLCCKDNTSPLSWQTRIRIAAELCSALAFLHSCKPNSIVHGDIKSESILLDAHFVSKLRISRHQKRTSEYADPGVGEVASPKSDVYSFGIILLRLLTGKNAVGILNEVQNAVDEGNLKEIVDPLAGDWPYVQAEQLANLGLRCCDVKRDKRPDLMSEVWRTLAPMRAFCGGGGSLQERSQPPPYFICPILQEVMEDPVVASDGFTYEAEALRGWLDSGHHSSPMTNISLAHTNLVPNRALRSAIQEWLHNPNSSRFYLFASAPLPSKQGVAFSLLCISEENTTSIQIYHIILGVCLV